MRKEGKTIVGFAPEGLPALCQGCGPKQALLAGLEAAAVSSCAQDCAACSMLAMACICQEACHLQLAP